MQKKDCKVMRTLFRYMLLPFLVGLIIFTGTCLIGPESVPDMPRGVPWDKVVHFGMFFLLSAVSLFDYYKLHEGEPSIFRWMLWGFMIPVIYGGGIELLQKYIFTSRSAEWGDWIADILGSLTALIIAIIYLQKRNKSRKNISL
jgi:VanZ family protein